MKQTYFLRTFSSEPSHKKTPLGFLFHFLILIFCLPGISPAGAQGTEKDFGPSLSIETLHLREIFALEKGQKAVVVFTSGENKVIELEGLVVSHINAGEKSGVLRLNLSYGSLQFKLLLNRKELNGKLRYQINLIQEKGGLTYRLSVEGKDRFLLEKTALSKIVSE
jgi:hypothetical protein